MGEELRREWGSILNHWAIAAVAVSISTGVGGALFAPSPGATLGARAAFAALGALAGLLIVVLVALSIALVRVPAGEYRERHRLRQLGQELMDVSYQMIFAAAPYKRAEDGSVALAEATDWTALIATYNTTMATRIFHATRELEKHDVVDREKRHRLTQTPSDLPSYFARVVDLTDLANLLGAEHPKKRIAPEMVIGSPDSRERSSSPAKSARGSGG